MTDAPEIPDENFSLTWEDDRRQPVPRTGSELEILTGFLDNHRTLFEQKCAGLSQTQLSTKAIPPSGLSLHGLLRHLSGVERLTLFNIKFLQLAAGFSGDQGFDRFKGTGSIIVLFFFLTGSNS